MIKTPRSVILSESLDNIFLPITGSTVPGQYVKKEDLDAVSYLVSYMVARDLDVYLTGRRLSDSIKGNMMFGDRVPLIGVGDEHGLFAVSCRLRDIAQAQSQVVIAGVSYNISGSSYGNMAEVKSLNAGFFLKPKISTLLQELPKENPHEMIDLSLMTERLFRQKYFR